MNDKNIIGGGKDNIINKQEIQKQAAAIAIQKIGNEVDSVVKHCAIISLMAAISGINKGALLEIFKQQFKVGIDHISNNPETSLGIDSAVGQIVDIKKIINMHSDTYFNMADAFIKNVQQPIEHEIADEQ